MAKRSIPRDARRAKGLTLADVRVTWTEGIGDRARRHHVAGASLARLVKYLQARSPHTEGHDPLGGDPGLVSDQLRALAAVVFPDAGQPPADVEQAVRFALSEYLEELGARLDAQDADPATYTLEVTT